MVKAQSAKEAFASEMRFGKVSVKCVFQHSAEVKAEVVFIYVFWKDDRSGKTGVFCKRKSNSLHKQAVKVYSL